MILYGRQGILFNSSGNHLGILYYIFYISIIFWVGFGLPVIKLGFDISYGIYIWHMPIINFFLVIHFPSMGFVITLTMLVALMSWFFVESPALRLKQKSLKS